MRINAIYNVTYLESSFHHIAFVIIPYRVLDCAVYVYFSNIIFIQKLSNWKMCHLFLSDNQNVSFSSQDKIPRINYFKKTIDIAFLLNNCNIPYIQIDAQCALSHINYTHVQT